MELFFDVFSIQPVKATHRISNFACRYVDSNRNSRLYLYKKYGDYAIVRYVALIGRIYCIYFFERVEQVGNSTHNG